MTEADIFVDGLLREDLKSVLAMYSKFYRKYHDLPEATRAGIAFAWTGESPEAVDRIRPILSACYGKRYFERKSLTAPKSQHREVKQDIYSSPSRDPGIRSDYPRPTRTRSAVQSHAAARSGWNSSMKPTHSGGVSRGATMLPREMGRREETEAHFEHKREVTHQVQHNTHRMDVSDMRSQQDTRDDSPGSRRRATRKPALPIEATRRAHSSVQQRAKSKTEGSEYDNQRNNNLHPRPRSVHIDAMRPDPIDTAHSGQEVRRKQSNESFTSPGTKEDSCAASHQEPWCAHCRENVAVVLCDEHCMLLCRGCDRDLHNRGITRDHKRVYIASVSAANMKPMSVVASSEPASPTGTHTGQRSVWSEGTNQLRNFVFDAPPPLLIPTVENLHGGPPSPPPPPEFGESMAVNYGNLSISHQTQMNSSGVSNPRVSSTNNNRGSLQVEASELPTPNPTTTTSARTCPPTPDVTTTTTTQPIHRKSELEDWFSHIPDPASPDQSDLKKPAPTHSLPNKPRSVVYRPPPNARSSQAVKAQPQPRYQAPARAISRPEQTSPEPPREAVPPQPSVIADKEHSVPKLTPLSCPVVVEVDLDESRAASRKGASVVQGSPPQMMLNSCTFQEPTASTPDTKDKPTTTSPARKKETVPKGLLSNNNKTNEEDVVPLVPSPAAVPSCPAAPPRGAPEGDIERFIDSLIKYKLDTVRSSYPRFGQSLQAATDSQLASLSKKWAKAQSTGSTGKALTTVLRTYYDQGSFEVATDSPAPVPPEPSTTKPNLSTIPEILAVPFEDVCAKYPLFERAVAQLSEDMKRRLVSCWVVEVCGSEDLRAFLQGLISKGTFISGNNESNLSHPSSNQRFGSVEALLEVPFEDLTELYPTFDSRVSALPDDMRRRLITCWVVERCTSDDVRSFLQSCIADGVFSSISPNTDEVLPKPKPVTVEWVLAQPMDVVLRDNPKFRESFTSLPTAKQTKLTSAWKKASMELQKTLQKCIDLGFFD